MASAFADRFKGAHPIDSSDARRTFRTVVDEVTASGRRYVIMRNGRPVAALVSLADLDHLLGHDTARDRGATQLALDGEKLDFADFIKLGAAESGVSGEVLAVAPPPLSLLAAEAAMTAIANLVVPQIAERASKIIVERLNERASGDGNLDAGEESEVVEEVLASIQSELVGHEHDAELEYEREIAGERG